MPIEKNNVADFIICGYKRDKNSSWWKHNMFTDIHVHHETYFLKLISF